LCQIALLKAFKNTIMKNFAEKLKKALKEKGMTQVELCEKIGMSQGGIKRMIDSGSTS
jgi:ribosome-binding protein aMBF1 (putative translation factor)